MSFNSNLPLTPNVKPAPLHSRTPHPPKETPAPVTPTHTPKPPQPGTKPVTHNPHLSKLQQLTNPGVQVKQLERSLSETHPGRVKSMVSKIEEQGTSLSALRSTDSSQASSSVAPKSETELQLEQITSKSKALIQQFNQIEEKIKNPSQDDDVMALKQTRDQLVGKISGQLKEERVAMGEVFASLEEKLTKNIVKTNLEPQIKILLDDKKSLLQQAKTATGSMQERIQNSLQQIDRQLEALDKSTENPEVRKSMDLISKQMMSHNKQIAQFTPFLNRDFNAQISGAPLKKVVMHSDTLERGTSKWQDTTEIEGKSVSHWQNELQLAYDKRDQLQEQRTSFADDLINLNGKLHKTSLDVTRIEACQRSITLLDQQMMALAPEIEKLEKTLQSSPGNVFRSKMDQGTRSDSSEHSNWEKTKTAFVSEQPFMMAAMTDFREQTVRQLTSSILADLEKEFNIPHLAKKIETQAFGSTNLTSDFDVSMSIRDAMLKEVPSEIATRVVSEFNEKFRTAFYVEAGSFFDTNLYTRGLAADITQELGSKNQDGVRVDGKGPLIWKHPEAEHSHNNNQDILSLTKQRKFMSQDQWDGYVNQLVEAFPPEKQGALRETYKQADLLFKSWDSELKEKISSLDPNHAQLPKDKQDALELKASNLLYTEKLFVADQIQSQYLKMEPGPEQEQAMANYRKALGNALLFANEPYFSEGTLRHVVMNEQALKKDPAKLLVNVHQGLQSVNENFGDTVKELEHMKHEGASFEKTAYKASKYIGRFARGMDVTLDALGPRSGPIKEKLGDILKMQQALLTIEPQLLILRAGNNPPPPDQKLSKDQYVQKLFNDQPALKHIKTVDQLSHEIENMALQFNIAIRQETLL